MKKAIFAFLLATGVASAADAPRRIKLEPEDAVHFLLWTREVESDAVKIHALQEHQKRFADLISGLVDAQRPKLADTKLNLRWLEEGGAIYFEEVPSNLPGPDVASVASIGSKP